MKTILVTSRKGGVGVTTVATALALSYAKAGHITALVSHEGTDAYALCGVAYSAVPVNVTENLRIIGRGSFVPSDVEVAIYDKGNVEADEVIVVVNNDYMTLRNSIVRPDQTPNFPVNHNFILQMDNNRILSEKDVLVVLGRTPLAIINLNEGVARASDAGLFTSRWDRFYGDFEKLVSPKETV
jgi:septum formation inhibitor-activating ATPase MinD